MAMFDETSGTSSPIRGVKQTKKIRFYRNGDSFFEGLNFAVSERFRTFEALMTALTNSAQLGDNRVLPKGVRYIFTTDGRKVTNLDELCDGETYVVSSTDMFKKINYARLASPSWNPSMRGGAVHKRIDDDFSKRREQPVTMEALAKELNEINSPAQKGRVFVVVRNGIKPRKIARILLNSRIAHSFEQVLDLFGQAFRTPPLKKIYTFDRHQITSLNELMTGPETTILACGTEKKADTDFILTEYEMQSLRTVKSNLSVTPPSEAILQTAAGGGKRYSSGMARSSSAPGTPRITRRNDNNGNDIVNEDGNQNGQSIGQLSLFSTPLQIKGSEENGAENGENGKPDGHRAAINESSHVEEELF